MKYNEHYSYQMGCKLANLIWKLVKGWDEFSRNTLGRQLVRAVDSISGNIAEGWHRYYKKDKILFFVYAKSSFYETIDYINKAAIRKLITNKDIDEINLIIKEFPKSINGLIKGTRTNLKK